MSLDNPKVSVCIPVYNGDKYIRECIESVLNQTYENIEIIVIDNNSTDNTRAVVESINDPRIKMHRNKKNIGIINNWNKCLSNIAMHYGKILCADDVLEPNHIEKCINKMEDNKDIGFVTSAYDVIDDKGTKLFSQNRLKNAGIYGGKKFILNLFKKGNLIGAPSQVTFRREAIRSFTFSDSKNRACAPDLDMWISILHNGYKLYYYDNILSKYRFHLEAGTATYDYKSEIFLYTYNRLWDKWKQILDIKHPTFIKLYFLKHSIIRLLTIPLLKLLIKLKK